LNPNLYTLNPKPSTLNPKHLWTQNPKIKDPEPLTPSSNL